MYLIAVVIADKEVDAIVQVFMIVRKYSVIWGVSGFSVRLYFYAVESGEFSKTMKMAQLK